MRNALLLLAALSSSASAAPQVRLAALILKTGDVDQDLADNLTEVLIARLATTKPIGPMELVGKEQLRARMGDERRALACIEDVACLGHIGVEMGITRIVVGTLGRRGSGYLYNLTLYDIGSGRAENRVFELVAGDVDALIGAVQATADKLFAPKVEPGAVRIASASQSALVYLDDAFIGSTPVRRDGIEPGPHRLRVEKEGHRGWASQVDVPAGQTLQITVPLSALPERRRWPVPFVAATAAVGAAAEVVAIVFATLSQQQPPPMQTRVAALADVERRQNLAIVADALFAGGAALLITSITFAIAYRKDLAGTREGTLSASLPSWSRALTGRFDF